MTKFIYVALFVLIWSSSYSALAVNCNSVVENTLSEEVLQYPKVKLILESFERSNFVELYLGRRLLLSGTSALKNVIPMKIKDLKSKPFSLKEEDLELMTSLFIETTINIHNKMKDLELWADYLKELYIDSANNLINEGTSDLYKGIFRQTGKVYGEPIRNILIARAKERGEEVVFVPKQIIMEDDSLFRSAVKNGPFIDLQFRSGGAHGQDIHILQWDYVSDIVYKNYDGRITDYLGPLSESTFKVRHSLFDEEAVSNPTSPDFFTHLLKNMGFNLF